MREVQESWWEVKGHHTSYKYTFMDKEKVFLVLRFHCKNIIRELVILLRNKSISSRLHYWI